MNRENIPLQLGEEIRPIQGYEGLYSITSFGRVWSHRRYKGKRWYGGHFLRLMEKRGGYLGLSLHKNNKLENFRTYNLVAQAFIPNPNNLPQVNHKDGNKQNNCVDNLEWCTAQENANHALINGLKYKKQSKYYGITFHKNLKQKKKPWEVQIWINGRKISLGYYKTELEAAKAYNDYVIEHNLNRSLNKIGDKII